MWLFQKSISTNLCHNTLMGKRSIFCFYTWINAWSFLSSALKKVSSTIPATSSELQKGSCAGIGGRSYGTRDSISPFIVVPVQQGFFLTGTFVGGGQNRGGGQIRTFWHDHRILSQRFANLPMHNKSIAFKRPVLPTDQLWISSIWYTGNFLRFSKDEIRLKSWIHTISRTKFALLERYKQHEFQLRIGLASKFIPNSPFTPLDRF